MLRACFVAKFFVLCKYTCKQVEITPKGFVMRCTFQLFVLKIQLHDLSSPKHKIWSIFRTDEGSVLQCENQLVPVPLWFSMSFKSWFWYQEDLCLCGICLLLYELYMNTCGSHLADNLWPWPANRHCTFQLQLIKNATVTKAKLIDVCLNSVTRLGRRGQLSWVLIEMGWGGGNWHFLQPHDCDDGVRGNWKSPLPTWGSHPNVLPHSYATDLSEKISLVLTCW